MKKLFFPLMALLVIVQSCSSSKKKAFDFNQKLAGISKTLFSKGQELGAELKAAMANNDYSKIAPLTDSVSKYIDDKIIDVKNTDNVAGSEKFKDAMLGYLNFEKQMITEAFLPFGKLNANSTEEEKQAAIDNLIAKNKDEEANLSKVQVTQKEYADKNGFKVE